MKTLNPSVLLLVCATLISTRASAEWMDFDTTGLYTGIGLGQASMAIGGVATGKDETGNYLRLSVGKELSKAFSVEGGLFRANLRSSEISNELCFNDAVIGCNAANYKATGIFVEARGKRMLSQRMGVFAKLGHANLKIERTDAGTGAGSGIVGDATESRNKFYFGFGAELDFTERISGRFQVDIIPLAGSNNVTGNRTDINAIYLGLIYKL